MTPTHFISYPKSGRSWVRFALSEMGAADGISFHHDNFEFNNGDCPAHNFNADARLNRYCAVEKIVYLERDPRDVMCSLFHQVTGRFDDFFHFKGDISDFLRHPYFGAVNLLRFRKMWTEIRQKRSVHYLTYEQMTSNPHETLSALLDYLEVAVASGCIRGAIEAADFPNMKKLEQSGRYSENWLKLRNDKPKVRKGKVGGYLSELCQEDIAYLNDLFGMSNLPIGAQR